MNFLRSFIILLILITVANAKHEGAFNVNDIDRSGDFFEIDTLSVKYSLDFLMGEIVLRANAKYTMGNYITIDGNVHKINEFPAEVQDKLRLTELKVEVGVVSDAGVPNIYAQMDLGAMGKPNEWSYNTTGSPDWNKFIYDSSSNYLGKEQTIKVMKQFRRFGLGEHLSSARTIAIGYDVSAARNYILKQKQDEVKKQKEKQDEEKKQKEKEVEKSLTEPKKTPSLMMDILDEMGSEKYDQKPYKTKTVTIDQPTKTSVDIKAPSINGKDSTSLNKANLIKKDSNPVQNTLGRNKKGSNNSLNLNGTKWEFYLAGNLKLESTLVIKNNKMVQKSFHKKKLHGLVKYDIIENPSKNCWIVTGVNWSVYRNKPETPLQKHTLLLFNDKFLRLANMNQNTCVDVDHLYDINDKGSVDHWEQVR